MSQPNPACVKQNLIVGEWQKDRIKINHGMYSEGDRKVNEVKCF